MSIKNKVGSQNKTVTYGNRALELFTDRNEFICLLAHYLHQDPTPERILFFHGAGGNGKTLLLEHLRQNCCKRFPNYIWQEIRQTMARSQVEAAASIVSHTEPDLFKPQPVAVIHDFGTPPIGNERPQDPLYGLLMLRRNISREAKKAPKKNRYKFKFPLFDFALFWYFHSIGKSSDEIKSLFPADEVDLIAQIIDAVADIPYVSLASSALKILSNYLGIGDKLKQRGISQENLAAIQGMDAERELIFHLPEFLAADLNAEMAMSKSPHRLVLFFDTHEKFWGENRSLQGERYFFQDEWLRNLLVNLDFDRGIMVVVSGRDKPKWSEATRYRIPEDYIELQVIEELTAADGRDYLEKAGISEPELVTAIINYAGVSEGLVHPFLLGLCVDVVESAKAKGIYLTPADFAEAAVTENKPKQLIERLLRYVDSSVAYAVRALSACRAFNFEIYQYLGESLNFSAMQPDFNLLIEFSFVWQDREKGEGWYRIHDLLRRLDRENPQETHLQAHHALGRYWQEREDIIQVIYHLNCLDWQQGISAWVELFDEALRLSRYDVCRSLLAIRSELTVGSDFMLGYISQSEGNYFAQLSLYDAAQKEFTEAITAYDRALTLAPEYILALNNKGKALINLGNSLEEPAARECFISALDSFSRSLAIAPNNSYIQNLHDELSAFLENRQ